MADVKGTYEININCKLTGGESAGNAVTAPDKKLSEGDDGADLSASQEKTKKQAQNGNAALILAGQYAQKAAISLVSNYGEITGDYTTQRKLQAATEAAAFVAAIVANPVVGGIAAAAHYGEKFSDYIIQNEKSKKNAAFLQTRVGFENGH